MTVVVTGAAGFIGTNLSAKLLREGEEVTGVDNFYSGRKENIDMLARNPGFNFINADVRNCVELRGQIKQIYHLACPASPPRYQEDMLFTLDSSVLGTRNMLELAERKGARILFSSTSEIYGNPLEHPQSESYWGNVNTVGERSCYDEGKRAAETYCYLFKKKGVDARVARIFNTYGPYMDENDGRVVSNFIMQALKNEDITIYGTGNQTRSFCYVDDMVDGLIALMAKQERAFGPVNLGNPGEFSMNELAEIVLKLTGSKSRIIHKELPSDDPERRKPDIAKAIKLLGWKPRIGLEQGLEKTIEYFRHRNF